MAKYLKREIWIEETEVELGADDVMTIAQAAAYLDVYPQAVSQALDRGDLTVIIDQDAPKRQGRRLVLRAEVESWKGRRERRQTQDHEGRFLYTW